jgi:hypothetical protein
MLDCLNMKPKQSCNIMSKAFDSALGSLHCIHVGNVADVSEAQAASICRDEVKYMLDNQ